MQFPHLSVVKKRPEASLAERGGGTRVLLALAPTGAPAGVTEVLVYDYRPWYLMQQGTATPGPHRNQGIGRWLKGAN